MSCYMHHTLAGLLGPVQREWGQTSASLRMRKSGALGMLQPLLSLRPAPHSENIEDSQCFSLSNKFNSFCKNNKPFCHFIT